MSRGFAQAVGTGIFGNTRLARSLARLIDRALLWVLAGLALVLLIAVNWFLAQPGWVQALLMLAAVAGVAVWADRRFGGRGQSALLARYQGRGQDRRTAVYYLRDEDAQLLYVGIAYDPERRWEQHKDDPQKQHWLWRIKDRQVEWYDTRDEAKAVETEVITGRRGPRPYFNKAENGSPAS